jgi:hypothetical protein
MSCDEVVIMALDPWPVCLSACVENCGLRLQALDGVYVACLLLIRYRPPDTSTISRNDLLKSNITNKHLPLPPHRHGPWGT